METLVPFLQRHSSKKGAHLSTSAGIIVRSLISTYQNYSLTAFPSHLDARAARFNPRLQNEELPFSSHRWTFSGYDRVKDDTASDHFRIYPQKSTDFARFSNLPLDSAKDCQIRLCKDQDPGHAFRRVQNTYCGFGILRDDVRKGDSGILGSEVHINCPPKGNCHRYRLLERIGALRVQVPSYWIGFSGLRVDSMDARQFSSADVRKAEAAASEGASVRSGEVQDFSKVNATEDGIIEKFDREKMLQVLRHVPQPVVVVTALEKPNSHQASNVSGDSENQETEKEPNLEEEKGFKLRGITCSSFTSVSLEPPLISICVRNQSHMLPVLSNTDGFAIHLLNENNCDLADFFAKPHRGHEDSCSWEGIDWSMANLSHLDPSEETAETNTNVSVPVLHGAMATLLCVRHASIPAGDHTVFLGKVLGLTHGGIFQPLVYMDRAFRGVGEALK